MLLLSQPSASLIALKKKKFFVSPYPVIGSYLLVTDFEVEPQDKDVAEVDKVKMELIKGGVNGWKNLPQKSIIGHVRINVCEQLTKEDCDEWKNSTTFEALTDEFIPGYFLCHVSEVARFKPVPTTSQTIITSFETLKIKCDAVRSKTEIR